ncbi:hypothetical protein XENTR_v10022995 [Xenopus tropicalis]|uniref:Uncharacterized protein LOC101732334 n=1 Tax=Xenopus tropicalis TaxID=8364 RepID=A0A8J1IV18_XENTR|eukprot:XP_004920641.1 PREDICTED: uncharacterized protein LOC101732334 [Xenopus tropicalis]
MAPTMAKIWWCFLVMCTMVRLCAPMQDSQMSPSHPAGPPIALYWTPTLLLIPILALALYILLPFWRKPQLNEEEDPCMKVLSCCGMGVPLGSMIVPPERV